MKIVPVQSSTRRVLSTVLIHAAAGVTIICAAPNTVPIHEPSSKPRPSPPRISARPKVVIFVLRDEMKAPSMTAATPMAGYSERLLTAEGTAAGATADDCTVTAEVASCR